MDGWLDIGLDGVILNLVKGVFARRGGLHIRRLRRNIAGFRGVGGVLAAARMGDGGDLINSAESNGPDTLLPAWVGKRVIGLRCARLRCVTRLLLSSETWYELCGSTAVMRPLRS